MLPKGNTYFDPIGYELYIEVESNEEVLPEMREAVMKLSEGFYPYAELADRLRRAEFSRKYPAQAEMEKDDFQTEWNNMLSQYRDSRSENFSYTPSGFKLPTRTANAAGKDILPICEQVIEYAHDLLYNKKIGKRPSLDELRFLMNCPTDDLRGIYAPRKIFRLNESLLMFCRRYMISKLQTV